MDINLLDAIILYMRKLISILVLLLSIQMLGAASVQGGIPIRDDLFWSEEELSKIDFSAPLDDDEKEYYENTHIYIVTAAPSEPVYIYFGHAGIAIDTPDMPEVMFDYGTFRFDDSFYMNFIFGRLYYTVIESYSSFRYDDFIASDRTVKKIELQLSPEAKKAVDSCPDAKRSAQIGRTSRRLGGSDPAGNLVRFVHRPAPRRALRIKMVRHRF